MRQDHLKVGHICKNEDKINGGSESKDILLPKLRFVRVFSLCGMLPFFFLFLLTSFFCNFACVVDATEDTKKERSLQKKKKND